MQDRSGHSKARQQKGDERATTAWMLGHIGTSLRQAVLAAVSAGCRNRRCCAASQLTVP